MATKVSIRIDGKTIKAASDFIRLICDIRNSFPAQPQRDDSDPHKVLGISQNATIEEIKKRYRQLCLIWHPDRQGGDLEAMKRLNEAYNLVCQEKTISHLTKT